MPLKHRLQQLLVRARRARNDNGPGCRVCRERRGQHVLVQGQQEAYGRITNDGDYPQPCVICGQVPEFVIQVLRSYGSPAPHRL